MVKSHGSVRIGPISLLTLVVVLCLSVLAVLSLVTARAEMSITERQAATTTETYQLETAGQQFLADLDATLANAAEASTSARSVAAANIENAVSDFLNNYENAANFEGAFITNFDGELITATLSLESGRTLAIVLRLDGASYCIEQWKTTTEWIDDGTGENLWLG